MLFLDRHPVVECAVMTREGRDSTAFRNDEGKPAVRIAVVGTKTSGNLLGVKDLIPGIANCQPPH